MAHESWDPETDAYVDRRRREGATYTVIAGELGLTVGAIAGRLQRRRARPGGGVPLSAERASQALEQSLGYARAMQDGCRWISGDPGRSDWAWCGQPLALGAYCAEHAARSRHARGETPDPVRGRL